MKILLTGASIDKVKLDLALQQAKAFNAEVFILASLMVGDKKYAFDSQEMSDAEKNLAEMKMDFEAAGVPCTTEMSAQGRSPGEDIVDFAKKNQIDLIIAGVRIRSMVGKILLGSTAQYVILNSPCPVLTVKNK